MDPAPAPGSSSDAPRPASSAETERLAAVAELQARIVAAGPDVDAVLTLVAEQARRLTGADGAAVEMLEGDEMVYRAATGSAEPFVGLRLRVDASLSGRAATTGEILSCQDAEEDPRVDRAAARRIGARSMVLVPLRRHGRPVGVLKVLHAEPHRFGPDAVTGLRVVAGMMSASIGEADAAAEREALSTRMRAIFAAAPDPIYAVDAESRLTLWSPSAETLYGFTSEDVMGRPLPMLDEEDRGLLPARLARLREVGGVERWETVHRRRDGSDVPVLVSAAAKLSEGGPERGWVFVVQDVRERNRLQQRLIQARKLEAIGRLAGGIAHDFNNMLTAITGFSRMLIDDPTLDEEQRQTAGEILGAARRSAYITRQLLAYSRRQVLEPRALDLNALVRDMRGIVAQLLGKNVHFEVTLQDGLPRLLADRGQLEQVLLNLLVNAREAIAPDPGTVTLRTDALELGEGDGPEDLEAGHYVRLSVSDTGRGIPEEVIDHVFEPFFTTKHLTEGTGLGLATVEGIVHQTGGRVTVDSAPGRGTTFRIWLPVPPELPERASPKPPPKRRPTVGATLLVVEDEDAVRRLIQRVLERAGYRVLAADRPGRALELVETAGHGIDAVVSDVVMPEMTGFDLHDRLRERLPSAPVLFVSGYVEQELDTRLQESGARFLAKPFTPEELTTAVDNLLQARAEG